MVFIFKTDLDSRQRIADLLHDISGIERWHIDLEDCDRVLKLVSSLDLTDRIILLLSENGILCEELP